MLERKQRDADLPDELQELALIRLLILKIGILLEQFAQEDLKDLWEVAD